MISATRKTALVLPLAVLLAVAAPAAWADFEAGLQHFKSGKYVEAAAEFQALVDQSPEYDYGYYILGLSFLKLNKLPDAEKNFRKALEINADKFEYHHGLANSLLERKQFREVVNVLSKAEGLATEVTTKYALFSMRGFAQASQKKWAEAIEDLEKARAIKKSNSITLQLGKAYFSLGHYDKAVPMFEEGLRQNPNDPEALQFLAEALLNLGKEARSETLKKQQYDAARKAAEKFRALKPDSFEAVNLVGRAALGAGDYPQAAQSFRQVLSMQPRYCYAMINLGKTYIAQQQWDSAESPLKDAAACSPREATIYESLGLVYQKFGKEAQERKAYDEAAAKYKQAVQHYDQAAKLKPSKFVDDARATIRENLGVIEHNVKMDAAEAEQRAAEEAERQRLAEEERKRKEWEERRKRDG